ncbi:MAG: hypothetical protein HKN23_05605 [Verrucomicrobiales bacterium]|nr:hypothetical protein [Verrucomicrobiales bacterium]
MSEVPVEKETFERPLRALRGAGTVFGVVFFDGSKVVFNETPFSRERATELAATLDDICFYFGNEGRDVDQISFGFDGGNMLIVTDQEYRIVVMHSLVDEVDFIAKAGRAFLIDYQMGIFASELNHTGAESAATITTGIEMPHPVEEQPGLDMSEVAAAVGAQEDQAATGPIRPVLDRPSTQPIPAMNNPSRRGTGPISAPPSAAPPSAVPPVAAPKRAVLADNQPDSTLPPPRKPSSSKD